MVGASGGSSAVRSLEVGQIRGLERDAAEIGAQLGRQLLRLVVDERAELGRRDLDGRVELGGRLRARARQLAVGGGDVAEPLERQPEVMVGPGVVRVLERARR